MKREDAIVPIAQDTTESRVVTQLLADRYSCRGFRSDPVPHEVIERILTISQLTASWCNSQPWQVVITEGEGTERFRKALYGHAASSTSPESRSDFPYPEYSGVYKQRRRDVAWQLYESVGIAMGDRAASGKQTLENFRFFGAPHVAIITSDRDLGVYGAVDCGGYVANFLTVAQSFGLSTIPQAALAHHSDFVRDYFKLPEDRRVVCGISFGYGDHKQAANSFRSLRVPLGDVVTWVNE